jgi:hypothetical protein
MTFSVGAYRAWMRALRIRDPKSLTDASIKRPSWRRSWPKPLTTRTPVTDSSTTPATSACHWSMSQLEGNIRFPIRQEVIAMRGSVIARTDAISGDSTSITHTDVTNINRLPSVIGVRTTTFVKACTSALLRDTSCPASSWSWRAKSRRCRRS